MDRDARDQLIEFLRLNRGLYIDGNEWCRMYEDTELFNYFNIAFEGEGDDYEIETLESGEDSPIGELDLRYYLPDGMAMAAHAPGRIAALDGAETVLVCNDDHVRGVTYNGNGAYRTYAQSICFIGIQNGDDNRTDFLEEIIEYLAGYRGTLTGTVTSMHSNEPIEGAEVEIINCNLEAVTDANGNFEISGIPLEDFTVSTFVSGFYMNITSYSFEGESELDIEVELEHPDNVTEAPNAPLGFGISAIYPNPFNPQTRVFVEYNQPSAVRLGVYDLAGRMIHEMFNGQVSAGRYSYPIQAANWNGGIYLVKLTSEQGQFVRKVVLTK